MTAYGPVQVLANITADADFRAWATGIHDALIAVGLVQTADTGQINLTTVTRPAGANTAGGYEIFRFSDSLQATVPVFIKIEYGTASTTASPGLWMTSGSGSNGAGTLTFAGPRNTATQTVGKGVSVTLPLYASGDTSRFVLLFSLDSANGSSAALISTERTRDNTGAYTSDGWVVSTAQGGPAGGSAVVQPGVAGGVQARGPTIPVAAAVNKPHVGTDIALGTEVVFLGKPLYAAHFVSIASGDYPGTATTFVATVLGAARTYLAYDLSGGHCNLNYLGDVLSRMCVLWE